MRTREENRRAAREHLEAALALADETQDGIAGYMQVDPVVALRSADRSSSDGWLRSGRLRSRVNPDFLKFADSFGIAAFGANSASELESSVRTAIALNKPAMVHVPHGETASMSRPRLIHIGQLGEVLNFSLCLAQAPPALWCQPHGVSARIL